MGVASMGHFGRRWAGNGVWPIAACYFVWPIGLSADNASAIRSSSAPSRRHCSGDPSFCSDRNIWLIAKEPLVRWGVASMGHFGRRWAGNGVWPIAACYFVWPIGLSADNASTVRSSSAPSRRHCPGDPGLCQTETFGLLLKNH
jgi:hypothetical protein